MRYIFILCNLCFFAGFYNLSKAEVPSEDKEQLGKVVSTYYLVKRNYVAEVPASLLSNGCLKGMLKEVDLSNQYIYADDYDEFMNVNSDMASLGFELVNRVGIPQVVTPIDNSPASKAGILPNDFLIGIDGVDLDGASVAEASKLLKGKIGSSVTLKIRTKGQSDPREVTLIRETIKVDNITAKVFDGDILYVRIASINKTTANDFVVELKRMGLDAAKGKKVVVLDLRNNPGGLLYETIAISSAFLKKDLLVVETRGRNSESTLSLKANAINYNRPDQPQIIWPSWLQDVPLIVIVNKGTASGAEMIVGALQDHGRALIVGGTTFGRGGIHSVLPLTNDSAVKIMTANWYTPKGRLISKIGIDPDIFLTEQELNTAQPSSTDAVVKRVIAIAKERFK